MEIATLLNIQIVSPRVSKKETIVFFQAENWTSDTESQLLHKVHELVATARPFGKKLCFNLEIETDDRDFMVTLIKKKLSKTENITTQKLSTREIEIVGLLMQGLSSEEIAEKLFISFETVKSHRKHILEKTGAKNVAALINFYHQTFFDK